MQDNHFSNGRLDSWKDIAAYLGRDVRTVIRWQEKGLPVHRVPGGKRQAVFAYRAEIDDWLLGRTTNENFTADVAEPRSIGLPQLSQVTSTPLARPKGLPVRVGGITFGVIAVLSLVAAAAVALFPKSRSSVRISGITRISRDGLSKVGLVTDGTKLYFSEHVNGRLQLSWIRVDGGIVSHIATPFTKALIEDISADGTDLLVRGRIGVEDETPLWIVPTNGQAPRRVGDILCHAAALSPDGKAIAYSRGNTIFLTSDEGITSRELYRFEFDPYDLHWSDLANRLRLVLRNPITVDLSAWEIEFGDQFVVRVVSRISQTPARCCVEWTDTSDYEFFVAGAEDQNSIWALPKRRLWWQSGTLQSVKLPTPLATVSSLTSDPRTGRMYAIGTEPSRAEFVRFEPFSSDYRPFLPGISGTFLDFSPDGKWITYMSFEDFRLWVARADGSGRRQVTFSFDVVELPRWSPDGTRIAFTAKRANQPWRIYIVPREGGDPVEASSSTDNQGAPTWSPDGKWLVYANVACQQTNNCAVHRIELASGKVETLPGSDGLRTARWSPDGRYIAALRPTEHHLLVFDLAKQNWTKLADWVVGDDLSWSNDSRYLYSNRPVSDAPEIFRVPVTGGKRESIVNLTSLSKLSGKLDTGLYVGPDNSIILSRQINSSDIYALDWSAP